MQLIARSAPSWLAPAPILWPQTYPSRVFEKIFTRALLVVAAVDAPARLCATKLLTSSYCSVQSLGLLMPVDIVAECIRVALTCAWTDSTDGFGMDPTTCSRHARCGLPHIYPRDSCVGQWLQQTCNNNRREENPWQATCT